MRWPEGCPCRAPGGRGLKTCLMQRIWTCRRMQTSLGTPWGVPGVYRGYVRVQVRLRPCRNVSRPAWRGARPLWTEPCEGLGPHH